ncbi:hypothetical protein B0H67DRAFT_644682 [Lasiosphaeris hirsuta]|uniref:Uncharacterized protein n=1 Tax=Lasiosphaeris hirsuta TaxID=260670 RepID=A0AA40AFG0_9PEZI|nr:hypothetical protein B0H67DRAFT_644682 [Lasiosphaeris hirsuta]
MSMRTLGGMLAETYASWLRSVSECCGLDEKPCRSIEKPIVVLRDQPAFIPPPSAEPVWISERTYEKTLERERGILGSSLRSRSRSRGAGAAGTPWFSRPPSSSSSRRRPKISSPSNFRHIHSESFQFPSPQPTQKRFSFRPLELPFDSRDHTLSPLFPDFDDGRGHDDDAHITPPPRAHTADGSKWDGASATLVNDRSYSSMSFHIPRKHVRGGSNTSQEPATPPSIPQRARARAYTAPNVERIVERIASAMIEKERLEAEIESIIERQSIYISSRPSTAYGIAELEPMPSIPALPAAAPSFAERLSSESRPQTAPSQANHACSFNNSNNMTPQERTLALATAAFNSHPPYHHLQYQSQQQQQYSPSSPSTRYGYDDSSFDRPLAPPLPLVLRPPLRKKKSFSRVSNWLFPNGGGGGGGGDDRQPGRVTSIDSVTNAPKPIKGSEGFYQCVAPPESGSGLSPDSKRVSGDSLSTWETESDGSGSVGEEGEGKTVPTSMTSWSRAGSSPVVQSTPKGTPVVVMGSRFETAGEESPTPAPRKMGVVGGKHRPQSVGVAF